MPPNRAAVIAGRGRSPASRVQHGRRALGALSSVGCAALVLMTAVSLPAQVPVPRQTLRARAQVWRPTNVPSMNLRVGEPGPDAFAPNETVRCEYQDQDLAGRSPKFQCRIAAADDVKVKFGAGNGEVYGEVAATRLLWALGFGADRVYPVRVICRGCPATIGQPGAAGERVVDPATIERKVGTELTTPDGGGWSWAELDLVDEHDGGAPRAQRDALKLLAVLLQHTDTKPEQQRLVCLDALDDAGRSCARPLMMLNDVGLTFGRATLLNANAVSGMNHTEWANAPVWKYATTCIGNLPRSLTGTLRDPVIGEEGRQFLGGLLMQLSDAQLRDLFEVSRADRRDAVPTDGDGTATVAQWVETFKQKRAAIVNRRCGDDWSMRAPVLFTTTPNLWLQSWRSPRVTAAMNLVSQLGSAPLYLAVAMLLAFVVNMRAGASLLVLLVLANVITDAAKTVVSYPRPDAVDTRIEMLASPHQVAAAPVSNIATADPLPAAQTVMAQFATLPSTLDAADVYGFPSGHVAVMIAFLCGLVFLFGWRRAWIAALIWVPLMGLARMYLGSDFLGDVIGGVAAGVVATAVVVRGLNLQRLRGRIDGRVLVKTLATAAACAALALTASVPPVYEAGRLVGATVALVLVSYGTPVGYDDASRVVQASRLGTAAAFSVVVWWLTTNVLHAYAGEPSSINAFLIGAVRMAALLPAPVLVERAAGWWR